MFAVILFVSSLGAATFTTSSARAYDGGYNDPSAATAFRSHYLASGASYTGATLEASFYGAGTRAGHISVPQSVGVVACEIGRGLSALTQLIGVTRHHCYSNRHRMEGRPHHRHKVGELCRPRLGHALNFGRLADSQPWDWIWNASASEWRVRARSDWGYPCALTEWFASGAANITLTSIYGSDRTACKEFLTDATGEMADVIAGKIGSVEAGTCPASLVDSLYSGNPGTCYQVVATDEEMKAYFGGHLADFVPFVAQASNRSTSGFYPSYSAGGFGNQAAQDDAASSVLDDDGFSPSGPGVDWALDDTSYPDPTARDANDYLQEFAPRLYYDTVEPYRATAIETITDNYDEDEGAFTNMLVDGSDAPMAWSDPSEQAGNSNDLALGFLGLIYPNLSVAESEDNLVEAEYGSTLGGSNAGNIADAWRLYSQPGFGDKAYGIVYDDTSNDTYILQYWLWYYHNPKQYFSAGEHQGDWEQVQVVVNARTQLPIVATYSQHTWRETCVWSDVEKTTDGRPVIYVGSESHASYVSSGDHDVTSIPYLVQDSADGSNSDGPADPTIVYVDYNDPPRWAEWPGQFGASEESPRGPLFQSKGASVEGAHDWSWDNEDEDFRICTL